jgi:hypothetical protein
MSAEIVLIARVSRRAEVHVNDLRDAEVFSHTTCIFLWVNLRTAAERT